jgi:hypothetical protein
VRQVVREAARHMGDHIALVEGERIESVRA